MSEHWYTREGSPCYEQVTQKGGLRATDLRDARKQGLVPSVTTVLGVVAKPQLEVWKVNQGIMAARAFHTFLLLIDLSPNSFINPINASNNSGAAAIRRALAFCSSVLSSI